MKIGFDVIGDLNLSPNDSFNWENKATSLYCIVAGNISNDLRTIGITLAHLSNFYQGVFYALGSLEYKDIPDIDKRTEDLDSLCSSLRKVVLLQRQVVIIDGIAILGCNGWYGDADSTTLVNEAKIQIEQYDDIRYLKSSIEKLQRHLDVKKIIIVSNAVPAAALCFGEMPESDQIPLNLALIADTEVKVSHWVYGTYKKIVDTTINSINYIANPYFKSNSYWAKRIEL